MTAMKPKAKKLGDIGAPKNKEKSGEPHGLAASADGMAPNRPFPGNNHQKKLSETLIRVIGENKQSEAELLETAKELLGKGASALHCSEIYQNKGTALMAAVEHGHLNLTKFLAPLSNVNATTFGGDTALMLAAAVSKKNEDEIFEALLPLSDAQMRDRRGLTILMALAMNGRSRAIELALPHCDPKEKRKNSFLSSENGATALMYAAQAADPKSVALLLPCSDVNEKQKAFGGNALFALLGEKGRGVAAQGVDYKKTLTVMLPWFKGKIDCMEENRQSPLSQAALNGHMECVKILAPLSPSVCAMEDAEASPCFAAIRGMQWEIADWLSAWVPESVVRSIHDLIGGEMLPQLAARFESLELAKVLTKNAGAPREAMSDAKATEEAGARQSNADKKDRNSKKFGGGRL